MKNIFYCSSVQKDIYAFNTRSMFQNYIDIDNLQYLPDGEIEVAVKEIIVDAHTLTSLNNNKVLALRSNICKESVFNNRFENILRMFNSENIFHVEFKKTAYFETREELLSNAKFSIIDLKTNSQPE